MKLPALELWVRTTRRLCSAEGWPQVLRAFSRQLEPGPRQVLAVALFNVARGRTLLAERRALRGVAPELRPLALAVAVKAWRTEGLDLCVICLGRRDVGALHETGPNLYTCSEVRCSRLWSIIRPQPAHRDTRDEETIQ
jgi:hypothetical protein